MTSLARKTSFLDMAALRLLLQVSRSNRCLVSASNCHLLRRPVGIRGSLRWKSTAATVVSPTSQSETAPKQDVEPPQRDELDLSFENAKAAYKSKTTWELLRAYIVLKMSSSDYIVNNHRELMNLGRKVLGKNLFRFVMRHTFYGHFVGGENAETIKPVVRRLSSFGVKAILDYSAEEDLSEAKAKQVEMAAFKPKSPPPSPVATEKTAEMKKYQAYEKFADRRFPHVTVRTYFYLSEAQCEKNMATFLRCIDAVAGATRGTGLAAVKMTALGRPQLLMQLSEVIAHTRKFFKEITGTEKNMALAEVSPTALEAKVKISSDREAFQKWLQRMDYDRKGLMNLFSWSGLVDTNYFISDLFKVPNLRTGKMEPIISALTEEEEEMFRNMMRRIHTIAKAARNKDVRVMIDAEQTYFQPAINRITMELMRKYNKEKAIIFNTYQCYLKDAYNNILLDVELAKRQGFYFGAKLVRGAYMEQERLRAISVGYEDPINPSYEATNEMYHKTLSEVLRQIVEQLPDNKIAIMVATHNEDSIRYTVKKMKELGISPDHKVVCFGQLLGMCDQVSFPLGQAGYSVYKYVPYGKIDEVIPYLSRRAVENNSLLKKIDKECGLLRKELTRRFVRGQFFYTPKGNYTPI